MILLDTNVISEALKPTPAAQVIDWLDQTFPDPFRERRAGARTRLDIGTLSGLGCADLVMHMDGSAPEMWRDNEQHLYGDL